MKDKLQTLYENLNEREKKYVAAMIAVAISLGTLVPVYLIQTSIYDLRQSNQEIQSVLQLFASSSQRLAQQEAEAEAQRQRYRRGAPALGSFLEAKVGNIEGLTMTDVNPQPDREVNDFTIRHHRARFQHSAGRCTSGHVVGVHMVAARAQRPAAASAALQHAADHQLAACCGRGQWQSVC